MIDTKFALVCLRRDKFRCFLFWFLVRGAGKALFFRQGDRGEKKV